VSSPNGKPVPGQALPLLAMLPAGVTAPQLRLVAQWQTGVGILCPPQLVPVQPLSPDHIMQLYIQLVNAGLVAQVVVAEDGTQSIQDLPSMNLTLRQPPKPEESAPNRIILP
jgi:hypothetical protein